MRFVLPTEAALGQVLFDSMTPDALYRLIALIAAPLFGLCIGSFLNVVIYRVPLGMKVSEPKRSFCPKCKRQLRAWENLPVLSWLLLRARCSGCKERISARYPFVELLIGAGFFFFVWVSPLAVAVPLCVFFCLLVAATFIDFDHMIIPHSVTFGGAVVGLISSIAVPALHGASGALGGLIASLIGAAVGGGSLFAVVQLGKLIFGKKKIRYEKPEAWKIAQPSEEEGPVFTIEGEGIEWWEMFGRKTDCLVLECETCWIGREKFDNEIVHFYEDRAEIPAKEKVFSLEDIPDASGKVNTVTIPREAMGLGDVWFLMMIGSFIGWKGVFVTILFSSLTGAFVGYGLRLIGKAAWSGRIPFGPYLAFGALVWVLAGPEIVAWWQGLFLPAGYR